VKVFLRDTDEIFKRGWWYSVGFLETYQEMKSAAGNMRKAYV
jgi:hypothetical protein